jgi:4-hydroxythreonine-4-phosphate dehydrogenase
MSLLPKRRIAVSIGDPNGVGLEIALRAHPLIPEEVTPLYIAPRYLVEEGSRILGVPIPDDFIVVEPEEILKIPALPRHSIEPGRVTPTGGKISYYTFLGAVELAKRGEVEGVVTLPINKEGWKLAGIEFKGHTDLLRHLFNREAVMVLGVPSLYVALFTEHIPLREVFNFLSRERLERFLVKIAHLIPLSPIGVLGLNPHAGDGGVLGREEIEIIGPAIERANQKLGEERFKGPLVPDTAFISPPPVLVALYHDQGLAPLKALHFREVINITLNLPIRRVSVGHGTAYDIAYKGVARLESYLNCFHHLLNSPF